VNTFKTKQSSRPCTKKSRLKSNCRQAGGGDLVCKMPSKGSTGTGAWITSIINS